MVNTVTLNESALQPYVNDFLKMDAKRTMKNGLVFMITHGVSLSRFKKLMAKLMAANDRFYQQKTMDFEKIDAVLADKDKAMLVKFFRYVKNKNNMGDVKKFKIPAGVKIDRVDADGVPAEWQIVPGASEDKVLLYYHGGGFFLSSPATHRALTIDIALQAKIKVLSVDYRLFPECTPEEMKEDGMRAYKWLLAQGIKPENIIIGGDSAGGGITLRTLLTLRDDGIQLPAGAVCISAIACSDLTDEPVMENLPTDAIFGTSGALILFGNMSPFFSDQDTPLNASLTGLPPLLFQATTCEMLFDHSRRMVEKAKEDGVEAELQSWDGLIHDFQLLGINYFPEAKKAIANIATFINNNVGKAQ
jgi:acetyl esterase/lipase